MTLYIGVLKDDGEEDFWIADNFLKRTEGNTLEIHRGSKIIRMYHSDVWRELTLYTDSNFEEVYG